MSGWRYSADGKTWSDPISARELKTLAARGIIAPNDRISGPGRPQPIRAEEIAGLEFGSPVQSPPEPSPTEDLLAGFTYRVGEQSSPPDEKERVSSGTGWNPLRILDLGFTRYLTPVLIRRLWLGAILSTLFSLTVGFAADLLWTIKRASTTERTEIVPGGGPFGLPAVETRKQTPGERTMAFVWLGVRWILFVPLSIVSLLGIRIVLECVDVVFRISENSPARE